MILIADSGSTKTQWICIDKKGRTKVFESIGLNPFYVDAQRISTELNKTLISDLPVSEIQKVYFYGAGCSSPSNNQVIINGLGPILGSAEIHVNSDVLGAARALFHFSPGIAIILGTGASSCEYNGSEIQNKTDALGYILGDEGSGAVLGKRLLQAYFNNILPSKIHDRFRTRYKIDVEVLKSKVYSGDRPNQYLASYTPFISENIVDPFLLNMVMDSFRKMFNYQLGGYKGWQEKEVRILGSVAYYFSDILNNIANDLNIKLGKIIKSPIEDLAAYHQANESNILL